jgi:CRISPR-associated Cas5-like protein
MKALVCHVYPSSLYSIKVPFTYQSSLVYPLPPPSTLKGLLANALQRWENIGPLAALAEVEREVRVVGAVPLGPIVVRDYIVSTVVNARGGSGKPTDALSRQYAFTPRFGMVVVSATDPFLDRQAEALLHTALYLGDSESLVVCESVTLQAVTAREGVPGEPFHTRTYVPLPWLEGYPSDQDVYWVHTVCWRPQALHPYLFPLQRDARVWRPAPITGRLAQAAEVAEIAEVGTVVLPPQSPAGRRQRRT